MFYKWGGNDILSISTFNHYSRILKVVVLDKGFPKGGGRGGPTFGKNSQIISFFFLRAYLKFSRRIQRQEMKS